MNDELIGTSAAMGELRRQIRCAARTREPVLVTGPSGSGKELVARAIHHTSNPNAPFEPINCAGFPVNLLDDELFGHEAGAFTDARTSRGGACERSGDGTLMLDEIGDLPLAAQGRLLRLLQHRRYRAIGARGDAELRARVVAATNVDLMTAIREGRFRVDLFHRFGVRIVVPSLSQRRSDIPALVEAFAHAAGCAAAFATDAVEQLVCREWPGEVRELKFYVEALLRNVEDRPIRGSHLGERDACETRERYRQITADVLSLGGNPEDHLEALHHNVRIEVLATHNGVVRAAARALGLHHTTLLYHLRKATS